MAKFNTLKIKRLLKLALLGPITPLFGAWSSTRRFPTRTIELDTFSFDSETGLITNKKNNTAESYKLVIDGMVEAPIALSYRELRSLPQVTQTSDFHCVEGWTIPEVVWGGVKIESVLEKAGNAAGQS